MLRLDFYESGIGETILVTFPGGGVGLVDAHPALDAVRPTIQELTRGKKIHFVCLTHPHADHGLDLRRVLESHPSVSAFWHTVSDVEVLVDSVRDFDNYPSPFQDVVRQTQKERADFLVDIFSAVANRSIPAHRLRNCDRPVVVDGVTVHCLGPSEQVQNELVAAWREHLRKAPPRKELPDDNRLSAILLLEYGGTTVLLGGDALKRNWNDAAAVFRGTGVAKARLLKVPHHGAADAFLAHPRSRETNYLGLCSKAPQSSAVLFAGDARHPNRDVFMALRRETQLTCLANGLAGQRRRLNPLGITIPGAAAASPSSVCNPVVTFEVGPDGVIKQTRGTCCGFCAPADLPAGTPAPTA